MNFKKILPIVIIILILGAGYILYTRLTVSEVSEAEQVEIYTAVIRQLYTTDDTFGGTLQPPVTYIISTTNDAIGDPDGERRDPVDLSERAQLQIAENLSDLPSQIYWVNSSNHVTIDPQTGEVANDGVIITLGNVHPKADGSVHVPASIYIANLAAGGQTYILQTSGGMWSITGTTGVQWIS